MEKNDFYKQTNFNYAVIEKFKDYERIIALFWCEVDANNFIEKCFNEQYRKFVYIIKQR